MDDHTPAEEAFAESIARARRICDLQQYLERIHTAALDTDDMLRAAVVLTVSALDYLVHEVIRVEAVRCSRERVPVEKLELPLSIMHGDPLKLDELVSTHIRSRNAHRSFVDPGKLADALIVFVSDPWDKIASKCGQTPKQAKSRLRTIYRWRNRIAHEADINPEYAGAAVWGIIYQDVCVVIDDVENLGKAILETIRQLARPNPLTPATS